MSCWVQIPALGIAQEASSTLPITLPLYGWTPYGASISFFGYFTDSNGLNTTTSATSVTVSPDFTSLYGVSISITGNVLTATGVDPGTVIGTAYPDANPYPGEAFQYLNAAPRTLVTYQNIDAASVVTQIGLTQYYTPSDNLYMRMPVTVTSPTSSIGGSVTDVVTFIQPLAPRAHYIIEHEVPSAVALGTH